MRSTAKPTNTRFWAVAAALAAVALGGCVGSAEATSSIYVKDALTDDAAEVHVTFTKAQVKQQGGGWATVYEGKQSIELLSLSAADARERLAWFDLEPGAYEGLRIFVSEVTVVHHDGTEQSLNVFGNIVSVADDFTVGEDGIDILVDFDLEQGVDLTASTYTPFVKAVQTSDDDHDDDGVDDVRDTDDDGDGVDDHEDGDRDGDGEDDEPRQVHAADLPELCAAERDDKLADKEAKRDEKLLEKGNKREEKLRDQQENLDEKLRDAEQKRDEKLRNEDDAEDRAEAWADYNETVAEARAEHDEEVADIEAEHGEDVAEAHAEYEEDVAEAHEDFEECLRGDGDDHEDRDDEHSGHGRNGTDDHDEDRDDDHSGHGRNGTDDHDGSDDVSDAGSQDDEDEGGSGDSGRDGGSGSGSGDDGDGGSDDEDDEDDQSSGT